MVHAPDLHSDPLYVKVYHLLKQRILQGQLSPGEPLRETNLAVDLQVSRTPVREALRRLEQDRLITAGPGGVYGVYRPSRTDVHDMCIAGAILEGGAARLAAERRTPEQLAALRSVMHQMIEAYDNNLQQKLLALDLQFHQVLVGASGSAILVELHDHLGTRLLHARRTSGDFSLHQHEILEQHAAIVEAVRRGDGPGAEQATWAHVMSVCARLLSGFSDKFGEG